MEKSVSSSSSSSSPPSPSPPSPSWSSSSTNGSRELQCVGRLEISSPKPVGFLCGSIPVPTDKAFHTFNSAAIIPSSSQTVKAPRYQMLPTETDLNMPPRVFKFQDKGPSIGILHSTPNTCDSPWESDSITSNFTRKCESLAVSGLVEYGDQIDVIAPADILKQIFKIPYTKARLSIAVHRIGQTLVLNKGPDIEEGEKLVGRHHNQSKCVDESLTLKFAMHSVRMEACDCPPNHNDPSNQQTNSFVLPGLFESRDNPVKYFGHPAPEESTRVFTHPDGVNRHGVENHSAYPQVKKDSYLLGSRKSNRQKGHDAVQKATQVGERLRYPVQESEKYRGLGNDRFLRAIFWKFHNFRMLLGSDLLLFSNEKYVAVSLHLWDITRQVTPLTWLEAWLDNVMASVPEVAICYHENGVVQGYELLKTNDIFLLKGISDDGTPAFHPDVVQQNGLSVLRFLQENCDQDPGAYWLYKNVGEDVIQLFDLSVIPKKSSSDDADDNSSSLPSLIHRGRSESIYSLGTLLYRIAHRLSLSMDPKNRAKCVGFFEKCLDFLDEPDHMVLRAFAHEQFARLILSLNEELDFISLSLPIGSIITAIEAHDDSLDILSNDCESIEHEKVLSLVVEDKPSFDTRSFQDSLLETSPNLILKADLSDTDKVIASDYTESKDLEETEQSFGNDNTLAMCKMSPSAGCMVETVSDPISSKLAAVHHVSQAIKSLRVTQQLQNIEAEMKDHVNPVHDRSSASLTFAVCACGDADCIEICDIREWLPKTKLDHKSWKLVLLLGESYLALGQAYKDDYQLHQALKVIDLACSVYGSVPQHLKDTKFISSMVCRSPSQEKSIDRSDYPRSYSGDAPKMRSTLPDEQLSLSYPFWAKAWTLVGDIYVEYHIKNGKDTPRASDARSTIRDLKVPSEVVKEVKRLKKKLRFDKENCSSCSLVNCSCKSDRASSGSSASSSGGDTRPLLYARKTRKPSVKKFQGDLDHSSHDLKKSSELGQITPDREGDTNINGSKSERVESTLEMHKPSEFSPSETTKVKKGGIFKFLGGPVVGDADFNLTAAVSCYEEARKALGGFRSDSATLLSTIKKIGWVYNELGRYRLERNELNKAELAFAHAINAFKQIPDHTNIILINCNLGHGRRALAEEMLSKMENFKKHAMFQDAYNQALDSVKLEYRESLRYYGAAKSELSSVIEEECFGSSNLKNEVYTQLAHTYLRIGMLLAREGTVTDIYENGALNDASIGFGERQIKKEMRKHQISANDAIREALSIYESLGDLRKQEAAYAYFQLASYQRDTCLKLCDPGNKESILSVGESSTFQRAKQYSSLAERNWQKAIDFYGPKTHPTMYMTILMERAELSLSLSTPFHSNALLESALSCLLEGRHVDCSYEDPQVHAKFWNQLQMLLKKMLSVMLSTSRTKSSPTTQQTTLANNRKVDVGKIRELYKMSLKSTDLNQLKAMFSLWTS